MQCSDGVCVPLTWICDGETDCIDGADEENCSTITPPGPFNFTDPGCFTGQERTPGFLCRDDSCIPNTWVCDGERDCIDGGDEEDCPSTANPEPPTSACEGEGMDPNDWFPCRSFDLEIDECIPIFFKCDGVQDCPDGSDEEACAPPTTEPAAPPSSAPGSVPGPGTANSEFLNLLRLLSTGQAQTSDINIHYHFHVNNCDNQEIEEGN